MVIVVGDCFRSELGLEGTLAMDQWTILLRLNELIERGR